MARQALTIGGAIIGSFFGYPQLGFVIGSIVGNYVDPQVIKTPGIQELPVQTASEGGYRQVVYGTCWINQTNIIDFGEVRRVTRRERQGKGGGPVVESERLYRTYAIGLGEPLEAIRVIRRDGKIVYDVRPGSTILADSAKFAERFRFYTGAEDQLPDPDLEALPHNGVGNTPYYRGTSYLVFPNDDLTDVQGRIPTYEVEGVKSGASYLLDVALVTDQQYYSGNARALTAAGSMGWANNISIVRVSPDGIYAAGGVNGSLAAGRFQIRKYDTGTGTWSALPNPSDYPVGWPKAFAWSPDGNYLAMTTEPFTGPASERIWIYKRTGDTFTRLAAPVSGLPSNASSWALAWNSDGSALAAGNADSVNSVYVWDFVGETLINRRGFASPGTNFIGGAPYRLDFNGDLLACQNSNGVFVVDTSQTPMPILDYAAGGYGIGVTHGCFWTADGGHIVSVDTDKVFVFAWDDATNQITLVDDYQILAAGAPDTSIDASRRYIACAEGNVEIVDLGAGGVPVPVVAYSLSATDVASVSFAELDSLPIIEAGQDTLAHVVEDISDRCGLAAAELDMSALDTVVLDGVTLGGGYNGADAITLFMPAYFFDLVQPEKVLTAVRRGGASVAAVTASDFVEEPDENLLRGQDIEFPRVLMLKYLNPGQNYAAPAAVVSRTSPDVRVSGEATTDLPISFDESGALQVADRMLKVMWEDLNGEVTFSLPSGPWAWLTPTDILTLSLRGGVYRIRVEKVEESAGVLKVTARRDRQSAYTSNLTAPSLPTPTPPPPALAGDTTFVVMNLPALVDGDDALGVYIAMTGGEDTAWSGAQVEYRVQGATDWTVLGTYTTRAVMGELLANLPAASPYYTDTTNPLSVSLVYTADQLESLTYAQFLSEGNPFAIVNTDFTAEIGQFRYAADDSNSDWTLTTLQRGRLNTTAGAHSTGDTFVMLDGAIFLPLPISVIGQTLEFRVTSIGNSPETAPTQTLVWVPQYSQYEFAPEFLSLERSGGTISGSWSPRHRFGTDVYPVASANFTGYQVTLTDGTVTNTFSTLDPEFSTSDAAYAGTITVTVAQTNRITGAGPSISESI